MSANKNSAVIEIGFPTSGYFAKEYAKHYQVFTPDKQPYFRLSKQSTDNHEKVIRNLLRTLNFDRKAAEAAAAAWAAVAEAEAKENIKLREVIEILADAEERITKACDLLTQ